jgi:aryl-alcohol dehydrogenase-like predicted oxidoreductase
MKLALGTAQFGMPYGVSNTVGKVDSEMVAQILRKAEYLGWNTLDTAVLYGESELILGTHGLNSWRVVSKLPEIPPECKDVSRWTRDMTLASLERLRIKKLHALLLHRPSQLLGAGGAKIYAALNELKVEGLVDKIGISIYNPAELEELVSKYSLGLVQTPFNILDRRIITSGWAQRLKSFGTEIHVRSIFLQGLLLMPEGKRPPKFHRWSEIWEEWDRWLADTGYTPIEACLSYINNHSIIDRIVVGVESIEQVECLTKTQNNNLKSLPAFMPLKDERIINPASWINL